MHIHNTLAVLVSAVFMSGTASANDLSLASLHSSLSLGLYHYQEYDLPGVSKGITQRVYELLAHYWYGTSDDAQGLLWWVGGSFGSGIGRYEGFTIIDHNDVTTPMATYVLSPRASLGYARGDTLLEVTAGYHARMEKLSTTTRDTRSWFHTDLAVRQQVASRWRIQMGFGCQYKASTKLVSSGQGGVGDARMLLPNTVAFTAGVGFKLSPGRWLALDARGWSTEESNVAETGKGFYVMEPKSRTLEVSLAYPF